MGHALIASVILALVWTVSEIPILCRKLMLTARKAVLTAVAASGISHRWIVEVAGMHAWSHHDWLVVLASVFVHGGAARLRVSCD